MRVLKNYVKKALLKHENKLDENKVLSYWEALRYILNFPHDKIIWTFINYIK